MIGQHFDTQWQYIKQLTNSVSRNDHVTKGMSKDIVYYVAKTKIDDKQIDFSDKDRETMDVFKAIIEKENASVLELHNAVLKSRTSPQDMQDAKVVEEVTAA